MKYTFREITGCARFLPIVIQLTAALLIASSQPASANATGEARQGIQAALARRALARQTHDLSGYMATFTPDWTTSNVGGRVVSYSTLRQSMARNFTLAPMTGVIQSKITQVTTQGRTVRVMVETRFDYPPQKAASGLTYPYKDTVASELWVKGRHGWQEQRERYLVDNRGLAAKPLTAFRRTLPRL